MNLPGFNIIGLFLKAAAENSERIALRFSKEETSYGQLLEEVQQRAGYYQKKGIRKGHRVLVFVPMSLDLYRTVLSLFYLGAVPVFLDEWVGRKRFALCCQAVPCQALIASRKMILLGSFVKEIRKIPLKLGIATRGADPVLQPAETLPGDTALISFTTGSTGLPKAADRTHAFLHAQFRALEPYLASMETSLTLLPVVVLVHLALGKTTVLPLPGFKIKKPRTLSLLLLQLELRQIDSLIAAPSIVLGMAALMKKQGQTNKSLLRLITGGGPLYPVDAGQILDVFQAVSGKAVFGSTEAEPIADISLGQLAAVSDNTVVQKGLPLGQIHPGLELELIPVNESNMGSLTTEEWRSFKLPEGAVGEIVVTGAHVLKAYINNPVALARQKFLVNGQTWHRTGDLGRVEGQNLFFLGRCQEAISFKNRMFYPVLVNYSFARVAARQAALLEVKGHPCLVVEGSPLKSSIVLDFLRNSGLEGAGILYIPKLPKDPRHQTKIDYEALKAGFEKGGRKTAVFHTWAGKS